MAPVSVVSFASAGSAVAEDVGTAWLKVTRTNPARAASVQYARVGGTARPGSDFVLVSGTLRFAAGQATASIPVKVVNDSVTEPAETVVVQLSRPGAGTALGTRRTWTQLTIRASDQRPDAMISTQSVYGYLGSYYYTSTGGGQVKVVSARAGQASYFYVRVYNRGDVTNTFVLRGSVPGGNASVRYYLRPAYLPWSSDVTSAMLSKAGLKLTLRPGGYAQFLVRINLGARATIGSTPSAVVNAQWFGDGWRTDLVRATVRVIR